MSVLSRKEAPRTPSVLKALFGSTGRAKLLVHFYMHPSEAFHIRQLARILGESPGSLSRDLHRLEAVRLLETAHVGNLVRYSLDTSHPLYSDLRQIVLKTAAVDSVLREALQPLGGIELAVLYGSFVKGEPTSKSDLDLMIVGTVADRALAPALAEAEKSLGREVAYTRYTRQEARARLKQRATFVRTVLAGPTVLVLGNQNDELFALARK